MKILNFLTRHWFIALALLTQSQLFIARAQNTVFTYQGRITDNGTNFTGLGQFKFALSYLINTSSQAFADADSSNVNGGGGLNGINVLYGGSGYVTPPAVTITSSELGAAGATAAAVLSGGSVISINITSQGSNYFDWALATVSITPPPANLTNITVWNNDGTTNWEPAAAVSLPVTNGLFSVTLGDTNLLNMTGIPADIFSTTSSLQLAIWFNDGMSGFSALTPLQNLTPTPLATYASSAGFANSASNFLGQLPTSQLTGPFSGNGNGLTSLNAANLTGVIDQANLGAENSYTPTIGDGSNNFITTTAVGNYTLVGSLVQVEIRLKWSSKGSAKPGSGLQISLPSQGFGVASSRATFSIGYISGLTYVNQLVAGANNGATYIFLASASNSGGEASGLTVANCGTGGELQITGTYRWR